MYINKKHSDSLIKAVADSKINSVSSDQSSFNNFCRKYITDSEEYCILSTRNFMTFFYQSKIIGSSPKEAFTRGNELVRFQLYPYDLRSLRFNVPYNVNKIHQTTENLMTQRIRLGKLCDYESQGSKYVLALNVDGTINALENDSDTFYQGYDIFAKEDHFGTLEVTNKSKVKADQMSYGDDEFSQISRQILTLYGVIESRKLDFSKYAELISLIHRLDTIVAEKQIKSLVDKALIPEDKAKMLIQKFKCNTKKSN